MAFDANGNWVNDIGSMSQWGNSGSGGFGSNAATNLQGFGGGVNTGLNQPNPFSVDVSTGGATQAAGSGGFNWLSSKGADGSFQEGALTPAIGAATGLAQSWLGFQNLGVAKDQLSFQKNAWQEQFNIQKEEYDYQKKRRSERQANYETSLSNNTAKSSNL